MVKIKNIVIHPDDADLHDFILELPQTFALTGKTLYTGRNVVKAFEVNGRTWVVKRYKRPNIVQRIAYSFFKKSKAERAYLYAEKLRQRGIRTPREVAYMELQEGVLLSDSFFVSEVCELPSLSQLLGNGYFDRDAADALARQLVVMHEKGVMHGDLNLTNILYKKNGDGDFEFWFIDTNRSSFIQPDKDDCLNNLKRLTHDRELLKYVVERYAVERGWDADETVSGVMKKLSDFEHHRAIHNRLKRLFKHKKDASAHLLKDKAGEDQPALQEANTKVQSEIDMQYHQYISDYFHLRDIKRKGFLHRHLLSLPLRAKVKMDRRTVIETYRKLRLEDLCPLSGGNGIIVSLTSFPSRIRTLHLVIYSILRQETRPDKITLWLSSDEFPNGKDSLGRCLTDLEDYGLEIHFVAGNLRSHKKYYYVFQTYPDSTVITIDDDTLYPIETISELLRLRKLFPGKVCCNISRRIIFREDNVLPYMSWPKNGSTTDNCSPLNVAIGCGGVLYPPHWYDEKLFDTELFMKNCPFADDLWLKANEIRCNVDVAGGYNNKIFFKLIELPNMKRNALQKQNNGRRNLNDVQWNNLDSLDNLDTMWGLKRKLLKYMEDVEKN